MLRRRFTLCFPENPISECPKSRKKAVAELLALSDDFSSDCLLARMSRPWSFFKARIQRRK
jgi:hypothetical protein